ncbi:MAG: hypothetical protein AAB075_02445 [Gemmatimonadota bacterium]
MRRFLILVTFAGLAGCATDMPLSDKTETPALVLARGQDQFQAMQRYLSPYAAKLRKEGYHPERLARFTAHFPREEWDYLRRLYTGEIRGESIAPHPGSPVYEIASAIRLTEAEGDPGLKIRNPRRTR